MNETQRQAAIDIAIFTGLGLLSIVVGLVIQSTIFWIIAGSLLVAAAFTCGTIAQEYWDRKNESS